MTALILAALLLVGAGGTVVVLTRDPLKQAIVLSVYGLLLTILFVVLQAPDVALSQLTIGAAIVPLMIVLAIAKARNQRKRQGADQSQNGGSDGTT